MVVYVFDLDVVDALLVQVLGNGFQKSGVVDY
jgi:hypothetical protein